MPKGTARSTGLQSPPRAVLISPGTTRHRLRCSRKPAEDRSGKSPVHAPRPEAFASQAVGKLMRCDHEENDEQNHRDSRILEKAGNVLNRVLPIREGDINGAKNDGR